MIKVMLCGTFDGIHEGHLNLFRQAKKKGDYLVVTVALDDTVERIKGKRPVRSQDERLKAVHICEDVDKARLGYVSDPYRVIFEEKPAVICLGYDQKAFTEKLDGALKDAGFSVTIYRLDPHYPEKYHSSLM